MITKKLKINSNIKLYVAVLCGQRYLILNYLNNQSYISLPASITVSKLDDFYILENSINSTTSINESRLFFSALESQYSSTFVVSKKKLLLKGLGFRMNLIKGDSVIEFKIGYSHMIQLKVPQALNVKINKNTLIIEGIDKTLLGNFSDKIISLKKPDCYKGKGFWYKYQKESLKIIKKK